MEESVFVPRHVLAALPGLPKFVRQRPMPGSWGSHDVSRVTTDAGTVVVKQWSGPHRMARGLAEAQVLGEGVHVGGEVRGQVDHQPLPW